MNDEERFHQLYGDTARSVYGFLRRRCDHDTAETVLSTVYLKAWKNLSAIDEDNPMGWLVATARTSLIDVQRQRRRSEQLVHDFASLVRHDEVLTIEGAVIDRMLVIRALAALEDLDREALLMVGWDGMSHVAAAQALGMSRPAFTQRVARARKRLTALLEPSHTGLTAVPLPIAQERPAQLKEA